MKDEKSHFESETTGGWKSTRTPLQYAEGINAARSGMARAAAATGRDEPVWEER
jgi:hypothetical protein